jgi:hypothetical protein
MAIVHEVKEDQTHPSMMAWRVHEFGPPEVMRFERVSRPAVSGSGCGKALFPDLIQASHGPTPAASTLTRISPRLGPITGTEAASM